MERPPHEPASAEPAPSRALMDALPAVIWSADACGARQWVNRVWSEWTGLDGAAALGWNWLEATPIEHRAAIRTALANIAASGLNATIEYPLRTADGQSIWIADRVRAYHDDQGQLRLAGCGVEISAPSGGMAMRAADGAASTVLPDDGSSRLPVTSPPAEDSASAPSPLHDVRRLFEQVEKLARIGGWEVDVASQSVRCTPGLNRLLGRPPEEIVPLEDALREYDTPDQEAIRALIERAIATHEPYAFDAWLTPQSGERMRVQAVGQVETIDRKAVRLYGAVQDVTERWALEQALREREARYRIVFNAMYEYLAILAPSGVALEINDGAVRRAGVAEESLAGSHLADFYCFAYSPELQARIRQDVARAAHGEFLRYEIEAEIAPGEMTCLDFSLKPAFDPSGRVTMIVAEARDVTDRKWAERQLVASEARYRFVVESMPPMLWVCDCAGRFTQCNGRWLSYAGRPLSELNRSGLGSLVQEDDRDGVAVAWEDARRQGTRFSIECRLRRASDGAERWHLLQSEPMRDGDGEILGWYGAATDIHDQKEAQAALAKAKEAAEGANRIKDEFLAHMSHELRTPLHGILGVVDLALADNPEGETRERWELVKHSGDALLYLVNDLLDLARIDAGKLQLQSQRFSPERELGQTLRSLAWRASEKGLSLVCQVDRHVPASVRGDALRWRQVIVNLVGNAIKFTDQGGVRVDLRCAETDADLLLVEVRDTGMGIPRDKFEAIFEAFVQVDATSTRRFDGTGLGLAIVRRLVTLLGGRVELESELGRGTLFRCSARLPSAEEAEIATESPRPDFQGRTSVLAVADPLRHEVLAEWLEAQGFRVETTSGWDQACQRADLLHRVGQPPPIVWIDIDPLAPAALQALYARYPSAKAAPGLVLLHSRARPAEPAQALPLAYLRQPSTPLDLHEALGSLNASADSSISSMTLPLAAPVGPLRILLAEDNLVNQRVATAMLERAGHAVHVVPTGAAALSAIHSQAFDLVLMDIQMPQMDGLEATARIRAWERIQGRRTPIVAMTAHATLEDETLCLRHGMDAALSKPIRWKQLEQALVKLFRAEG